MKACRQSTIARAILFSKGIKLWVIMHAIVVDENCDDDSRNPNIAYLNLICQPDTNKVNKNSLPSLRYRHKELLPAEGSHRRLPFDFW